MKHSLAIILVTVFATSSFAEDTASAKKGKSPWQVMQLKKTLGPVTLTAEQETGFAEVVETYTAKITELEGKGKGKKKPADGE